MSGRIATTLAAAAASAALVAGCGGSSSHSSSTLTTEHAPANAASTATTTPVPTPAPTAGGRTAQQVMSCLQAAGQTVTAVPAGTTKPTPVASLLVGSNVAAITLYASTAVAASAYQHDPASAPVVQSGNVVIDAIGGRAQLAKIQSCAFGPSPGAIASHLK